MTWVWLVGMSLAAPSLVRPSPPQPAPGECSQSTPISKGQPLPLELVANGVAACGAVAEPTSSLAYLLAVERYSQAADEMHAIQVAQLHAEIDGLRTPVPWHARPNAQRWFGRLEVLGLVGVVSLGAWAISAQGSE